MSFVTLTLLRMTHMNKCHCHLENCYNRGGNNGDDLKTRKFLLKYCALRRVTL